MMAAWRSFWAGFWYVLGPANPAKELPDVEDTCAAWIGAQTAVVCTIVVAAAVITAVAAVIIT